MFRRIFTSRTVRLFSNTSGSNMIQPHLAEGSQEPPRVEGKLRLYSMEYCPYAQRVRLVLEAKNIPYDIVNIDLVKKPSWYFKFHPDGLVPAIDTGSEVVIESLDISDFLDAKYPQNHLYSSDAETKKGQRELIEKIAPLSSIFYKFVMKKGQKTSQEWANEMASLLQDYENELEKRGTFFGGNKPGMVDYMLWPWGERSLVGPFAYGVDLFSVDKFPHLRKWRDAMLKDPAAKSSFYGPEVHMRLIECRQKKIPPNYNNLASKL